MNLTICCLVFTRNARPKVLQRSLTNTKECFLYTLFLCYQKLQTEEGIFNTLQQKKKKKMKSIVALLCSVCSLVAAKLNAPTRATTGLPRSAPPLLSWLHADWAERLDDRARGLPVQWDRQSPQWGLHKVLTAYPRTSQRATPKYASCPCMTSKLRSILLIPPFLLSRDHSRQSSLAVFATMSWRRLRHDKVSSKHVPYSTHTSNVPWLSCLRMC